MTVTTLTSREFNQDVSGAKKAARRGPVFITDRGRPAHVLLLTDMNMPGLDGLEAVKAFTHMKPPLVVVAMSGGSARSSSEDYSVLALRMGAHAFLGKPFKRAQLVEALEEAKKTSR